ncbi:MAG: hypothetical protein IH983_01685 [Planctomycetes bacterium]|nr:hypothetical protein [Planctomycetota bacterium]
MSTESKEKLQVAALAQLVRLFEDLENERGKKRGGRFSRCVNSPFFITVIGGSLLALVSLVWQSNSDSAKQQRALVQAEIQEKQQLLESFSINFCQSLGYALEWKKRQFYIQKHPFVEGSKGAEPPPWTDHRSYAETRAFYEKMLIKYLEAGAFDALCARVTATFQSDSVLQRAHTLDATMDNFVESKSRVEMSKAYKAADREYQDLIAVMGNEIKAYTISK